MNEPFERAITLIDAANVEDPRRDSVGVESVPRELLYSRRFAPPIAVAERVVELGRVAPRIRVPAPA